MKFFKRNSTFSYQDSIEKQFWDNTAYGAHSAPAYDTVDRIHPDGYGNFLFDFNKFSFGHFTGFPNIRRSKVDPNLFVSNNQWVVSLVRKKDHAVIVVESVGYADDQGLCMRWYDFLPKNKPHAPRVCFGLLTNLQALENKTVTGMVRYCPTNTGRPLLDIPNQITKKSLFSKLNWNEDADSWLCSPLDVKTLMDDIKNDFSLGAEGKLKFKFCGHTIPNCTTWTWDKLQSAGINAENDNFQNRFIIRASKNIGTKRHHYP